MFVGCLGGCFLSGMFSVFAGLAGLAAGGARPAVLPDVDAGSLLLKHEPIVVVGVKCVWSDDVRV